MAISDFEAIDLVLLTKLFDHLTDQPFFLKDAALRYVAANQSMAALCGAASPRALIGRTAADFFPDAVSSRYEALDRQVISSGRGVYDRLDLSFRARRSPVWLFFSRLPIKNAAGEVSGVAAIGRSLGAPDKTRPIYERLALVVERIASDVAAPLDLPGLAALAGISASQLERDFRRLFGITLQAYHGRARIDRALRLLETSRPVSEIAQDCGYSDHSAFCRRFKSEVGLTPSRYRKSLSA